ncbi:MAG: helix-turn-helix domain-containing protein [Candidatus Omnitrophota bacterium]
MPDYDGTSNKPVGEVLKEARESKGISLTTVHEMTKIPMDVLKAIEEGYTVRTISPFYLKGFIKMYAQYLEINVDHLLQKEPRVVQSEKKETLPKKKPFVKKYEREVNDVFWTKQRQRQAVQIAAGVIGFLILVKMVGCLMRGDPDQPAREAGRQTRTASMVRPDVEQPKPLPKPKPKPRPGQQAETRSTENAPAAKPQQEKKTVEGVNLTIRAKRRGWLQVKVDGVVVLETTVEEGAVEAWHADESIVISGKTIHALEYELNGRHLGSLGRADRSARRVVVTEDGLQVKD